jgi:hypothetical protein
MEANNQSGYATDTNILLQSSLYHLHVENSLSVHFVKYSQWKQYSSEISVAFQWNIHYIPTDKGLHILWDKSLRFCKLVAKVLAA